MPSVTLLSSVNADASGAERSAAQKLQELQGTIAAADRRRLPEKPRRFGEILGHERSAQMQLAEPDDSRGVERFSRLRTSPIPRCVSTGPDAESRSS